MCKFEDFDSCDVCNNYKCKYHDMFNKILLIKSEDENMTDEDYTYWIKQIKQAEKELDDRIVTGKEYDKLYTKYYKVKILLIKIKDDIDKLLKIIGYDSKRFKEF